ncbi:hypothetical protein [Gordonia sp. NPDC003376]
MTRITRRSNLVIAALVLVAATMLLPWSVAEWWTATTWDGPGGLAHSVGAGLAGDWTHRIAVPGEGLSALAEPTRFWRWFHIVKAVLAVGVLTVSVLLVIRCRQGRGTSESRRAVVIRRLLCSAGVALAGLSLITVIANIQGAVAPLSSVMSFLPQAADDASVRPVIPQVRADLAGPTRSPATDVLVHDFSSYHGVVAVLAAMTALALVAIGVRFRRRRATGVLALITATGFAVLAAANLGTALDPAPAFGAFLGGL